MANAAAFGSGGRPVGDVKSAILRVGHATVRSVATAVAMEQLKGESTLPPFRAIAEAAWRHSVDVAAVAHVLAKRLSRINPDEALFAGLVHDIGHFYLLSQAQHFPEILDDPAELAHILQEWHPSIGRALLHDFNMSEAVLEAVAEHENAHYRLPLRTLTDIVTLANLSSAATNPVVAYRTVPPGKLGEPEVMTALVQAREEIAALAAALRGC
jgi:putative nucleotidyltransferase with HDIG domain